MQDALPLENVSAYTLSQEALLSQPELSDVALIAAVRVSFHFIILLLNIDCRIIQLQFKFIEWCSLQGHSTFVCTGLFANCCPLTIFLLFAVALFTSGLKETTESQVSLAKPRAV